MYVKDLFIKTIASALLVFIGAFIQKRVYAQPIQDIEVETWQKTSLDSNYVTSVENTTWGLVVGENDYAPWVGKYNGIYISKDYGESWNYSGLESTGINAIYYDEESQSIYVCTKYKKDGKVGLYKSMDGGMTWTHYDQINFGGTKVAVEESKILYGSANNGLWESNDDGETWIQTIGNGYYGPEILEIYVTEKLALVSSTDTSYIRNQEQTEWQEIEDLRGKKIRSFVSVGEDIVFGGAANNEGMYISEDKGISWRNIESWGNKPVGKLLYLRGILYASGQEENLNQTVYISDNYGKSWINTNLITSDPSTNIKDLEWSYGAPSYIYAATHYDGLYKLKLENFSNQSISMFSIPWEHEDGENLIDKISSYFDHSYPLLGYRYFYEPEDLNKTTLNFLGEIGTEPDIYYSSHNGIDFALPYGTNVLATADGYATYYYCTDCGHSIKVDHENGYESTYMHLQSDGLITTEQIPIYVEKGDIIGKVGLSGNTTGPHLHFSVTKDKNRNGSFVDDWPYGLVDPFGWKTKMYTDPWSKFSWVDILGEHYGENSANLWINSQEVRENNLTNTNNKDVVVNLDNKKVTFGTSKLLKQLSSQIYFSTFPHPVPNTLEYIFNTSVKINVLDNFGNLVKYLEEPTTIEIDYSQADIENIVEASLKIYHWNNNLKLWDPINNIVIDTINKTVKGTTNNFSKFAVFGEKMDTTPPQIDIRIEGIQNEDNWFTEYPEISFDIYENQEDINILFKPGNNISWTNYKEPFLIEHEGLIGLQYIAYDQYYNWTKQKDLLLKINTSGNEVGSVNIVNTKISIR